MNDELEELNGDTAGNAGADGGTAANPPERPDARLLAGRYQFIRTVARGGMSVIYLAHDTRLDRPVAVKVLFDGLAHNPNFVERFRREARSAAKLNHPHIVKVYDSGQDGNVYFITMEYLEGQSLSEVLQAEGTLAVETATKITEDVAEALAEAHRQGVIHRDIKPGNIIFVPATGLKVADFGIARAISGSIGDLTQAGTVMGTATYFSPEQAKGEAVDYRTDLYSVGIVLYEMLAGKPPFHGDSPISVAYQHVQNPPAPLTEVTGGVVPPILSAVVDKLLAKNPADRYQDAEELRVALRSMRKGGLLKPGAATGQLGAAVAGQTGAELQALQGATGSQPSQPDSGMPAKPGRRAKPDKPAGGRRVRKRRLAAADAAVATAAATAATAATTAALPGTGIAAGGADHSESVSQPQASSVPPNAGPARSGPPVPPAPGSPPQPGPPPPSSPVSPEAPPGTPPPPSSPARPGTPPSLPPPPPGPPTGPKPNPGQPPHRSPKSDTEELVVRQRRRTILFWGSFALLLAIIALVVTVVFTNNRVSEPEPAETTVAIPSVIRLPEEAAHRELSTLGFEVAIQREENAVIPAGQVIRQEPRAGSKRTPEGTEVLLVVSEGAEAVPVPDVTEWQVTDASRRLRDTGFVPLLIEVESGQPLGEVVDQDPRAGDQLAPGSQVTLSISKGLVTTMVPDVIGLSISEASRLISDVGLVVRQTRSASDTVPAGNVIATTPSAGVTLDRDQTVNVFVSTGPSVLNMPDVTGLDEAVAVSELRSWGLEVIVVYRAVLPGEIEGTVVAQTPLPDAQIGQTDSYEVTIVVGAPGNETQTPTSLRPPPELPPEDPSEDPTATTPEQPPALPEIPQ